MKEEKQKNVKDNLKKKEKLVRSSVLVLGIIMVDV